MNIDFISSIIEKLKVANYSMSSIESFTGGLFSSTVTSISGVSSFFIGGFVTYTNEMKELIGVRKETLEKYSAVSEQTAREMAISCHNKTKSDIAVSFTGNAGPNGSENKKVGLIYIGVYFNGEIYVENYDLESKHMSRNEIRDFAIEESFLLIDKFCLKGNN